MHSPREPSHARPALTLLAFALCACSGSDVPDHGVPGVPLTGCALVGYSAPIQIGASQVFQLTVDSASTTLAVASVACAGCADVVAPLYGDTGMATGNTVGAQYADGSGWQAAVYSDSIQAVGGPPKAVSLDFGAITSQTGFFIPQDCAADLDAGASPNQGTLGLGNTDLLAPGTTSYFAQLAGTGVANAFSARLCPSGGTLWLGGYDATATKAAPTYTPMVSSDYWSVSGTDVLLGTQSLGAGFTDWNPVTVDTATSVIVFPDDVYTAVTRAIVANAAFQSTFGPLDAGFFDSASCAPPLQAMTTAQIDASLPMLTFEFPGTSTGTTIQVSGLPTQSYLTPLASGGVTFYCAAVESLGTVSSGTILGDTFLQGWVTVFDIGGQRIGFASPQPCPDPPAPPPAPPGAELHVSFRNPRG